jgi:hypothetical protein
MKKQLTADTSPISSANSRRVPAKLTGMGVFEPLVERLHERDPQDWDPSLFDQR